MNLRGNLGKIVFASTVGLGLLGCNSNPEYYFDAKIGDEKIRFTESLEILSSPYYKHYLEVTKPDGRIIKYVADIHGNLKINYVEITTQGITKKYSFNTPYGKEVVETAQKQFDEYLKKILEIKKQEGLKNLK